MSQKLLEALMQLFAIIADVDDVSNASRNVVENFLKQRLNQDMVDHYLSVYDGYLEAHHSVSKRKDGSKKRTSVNSVKVLRICTQINSELAQKQKVFILIRLIEYIFTDKEINQQELEFLTTVADAFNIPSDEFKEILEFVDCKEDSIPNNSNILILGNSEIQTNKEYKQINNEALDKDVIILNIASVGMYSLRYFGENELLLNGQVIDPYKVYILTQGSSIRSSKVSPVYYSDIIGQFLSDKNESKLVFTANGIEYYFKGGKQGLHTLNFSEESGKLIGIMGGSGSGKSTLLNILNGTYTPSKGAVTINGKNIHLDKKQIEGVIGYISQDDLLIEDLSVYENLYRNAQLCFSGMSDEEIHERVAKMLNQLGLYEFKDLKVGNPIDKKISGGQRKRLNCALELIREPSVLFVDEPTSGLSSRDSENIMDLLKELALKGKLVFVVIHQPSSDIYKMFDKLMIMDMGGYPIYYGNPLDAVIYFKTQANQIKAEESECPNCGNVNPEQVFNIIEQKVVNEYGNLTDNRKTFPQEWNSKYRTNLEAPVNADNFADEAIPPSTFKKPNRFRQFQVFITRDVLSKIANRQYLIINLLEAPLLGLILSYFTKFSDSDINNKLGYVFSQNENIPVYIFMAVIVSLFLGLTVSAEEIIKDQKIRKRESFLNLSNFSYLASKIAIMFIISAIQSFLFLLIGNSMLEIQGMYFDYWLVLFSVSCFANMLGLNVSASFNSAVTIYILIPFLIIPELLFCGVVVKFEKLNPAITSQENVPFIGEIMASRWAFEALAVRQFKENEYESQFYTLNWKMSIAQFKKNFWMTNLRDKVTLLENALNKDLKNESVANALILLRNEITKENEFLKDSQFDNPERITIENLDSRLISDLRSYLTKKNTFYIKLYNNASDERDEKINSLSDSPEAKAIFQATKNDHENESLKNLLTNKNELSQIIEVDNKLIQRDAPIYLDPMHTRAHFYAPRKLFAGKLYDTYWYNIVIMWLMSIALMITLYFDMFRKFLDFFGNLWTWLMESNLLPKKKKKVVVITE